MSSSTQSPGGGRGTLRLCGPVEPQRVDAPLTASAVFLVVTINQEPQPQHLRNDNYSPAAVQTVRVTLAGISDLIKNVAFRDLTSNFACTVGIGSDVWDVVFGCNPKVPRPAELHPFHEVKGSKHTAVSTPGDLLFHIRAERRDLCFEFERQLMESLEGAVSVVDETVGFRYFENRDLLGFVDGTANPTGSLAIPDATLITEAEDDPVVAGGSYVVVQKYVHNMATWRSLSAEQQEAIIGRTKLDNTELADAKGARSQRSHKTLNTIEAEIENGGVLDILRDNMPFGSPGRGEFGTYFIGYTRRLWVIEKMLRKMFCGEPPGLHDRLLDYSTPLTGWVFFIPSASLLASIPADD